MRILIIENEVYLAQSIATKLTELGHSCEICTSARDAIKEKDFHVVLLSTSLNSHDLTPIIENFKDTIIILMVSYISNDTVSKPLSAGAKDYIVKPFMIEELVRKIDHHQDYKRLKEESQMMQEYLDFIFEEQNNKYDFTNITLPCFLQTPAQKNANGFIYYYARYLNEAFEFINLDDPKSFERIKEAKNSSLLYIVNFQNLKKGERKDFFELIKEKRAIISTLESIDDIPYKLIELQNEHNSFAQGEILPIEEYVKYIVINYQHKYPDTELSKKLGISRKSLWEKRKKYDIIKKK